MGEETSAIYGKGIFGRSIYGRVVVFKDPRDCLFSLKAWKKTAASGSGFAGIYQRQPTSKGQIVRRLKLYAPTNPRTEAQQANRQKIADAVEAWQGLTEEQRNQYNKRARFQPFTGYNLFIKEYLKSH